MSEELVTLEEEVNNLLAGSGFVGIVRRVLDQDAMEIRVAVYPRYVCKSFTHEQLQKQHTTHFLRHEVGLLKQQLKDELARLAK